MTDEPLEGRCLCGACRFTATPRNDWAGTCHCSMCRRWSGGTFIGVDCGDALRFEDESALRVYVSSDWGERLFCGTCGSSLIWRTRDRAANVVSVQCFEDPSQFPLQSEIFVDDAPGSYAFAGDHRQMTGAEVMAQFLNKETRE